MREFFTSTDPIPVSELRLDPKNYRIGPLDSQQDCIEMMLKEFGPKIINLANHIANNGLSIQPIVVSKEDGYWLVRDGNRRVTALRLLNNPSEAPERYRGKFKELRDTSPLPNGIPENIICETSDEEHIREYVLLTHMGQLDGIGQVRWGPREKDNMLADTGGMRTNALAEAVCKYLEGKGVTEASSVNNITNIQRLLQDLSIQKRIGISWDEKTLSFTGNENDLFPILKEIVLDFSIRRKKVGAIYSQVDRENYLTALFCEHNFEEPAPAQSPTQPALPQSSPLKKGHTPKSATGSSAAIPVVSKPACDRKRVIPYRQGLPIPRTETKAISILAELGHRGLEVKNNPIAAGVLIRLLIEFGVEYYVKKHKVPLGQNDKLHQRIRKAGEDMEKTGLINNKQLQILKKMGNSDELISAHTMNAWAHNPNYTPRAQDICTFWDNLRFFLEKCWR